MRTRVEGASFGLWKRVIGSKTLGYILGELSLLVLPFLFFSSVVISVVRSCLFVCFLGFLGGSGGVFGELGS